MNILKTLSDWSVSKQAWTVLFISAISLELSALIFQHGFGFNPCVLCIYQRTAILGIALSGLIVIAFNHVVTRLIAYAIWLSSAVWGTVVANEHVNVLNATNPFAVTCPIEPNFPAFLPLHEWLPSIFAATGMCDDTSWQFLSKTMPEWLIGVFIAYALCAILFLALRLVIAKRP